MSDKMHGSQEFISAKLKLMEERCRKNRLSLTAQRRAILENLSSRKDHPTADQIYLSIRDRITGVSRTTVYRVLETFVQLGLAQKISTPEAKARFDADTSRHHHAACLECEKIIDFDGAALPDIDLSGVDLKGFEVSDCALVAIGLCKECADMPQTINTNIASLNAQRNLNTSQTSLATSMQRLSSGLRVNSAKDDAAGMAIAERMNAQVRGMNVAIRNANDAISLSQTAEGAIGKVADMMQRMRELAVQSANATNGTSDRVSLDQEFQALADEIDRTLTTTRFNGLAILATNAGTPQVFQVGANAGETITVTTTRLDNNTTVQSVTGATSAISTVASASAALGAIDAALDLLNSERATYGASQNRFEAVISNLQVAAENQSAARARIMDADFAAETANLSRAQILQQAGTAMVAQANQLPQQVLQLLRS